MTPYAVIIANGGFPTPSKVRGIVRQASMVVCADGGARLARRLGIRPDVVIGDLDSLPRAVLGRLKRSKVIVSGDQNQTDLEKAIRYLLKHKTKRIVILAATGKRIDQTLANIALLVKYQTQADLTLVDPTGEILIVQTKVTFPAKCGATVSLLPIDGAPRVTTKGLRYALKNETLEFGSRGVSNEVIDSVVDIRVRGGRLLLIKLF
jgi:thiamine pyrophosphokinase